MPSIRSRTKCRLPGSRRDSRCGRLLAAGLLAVSLATFLAAPAQAVVRRRITIRSNPPGALVYIDDQEIGVTPVSTSFVYYGTRKIQLLKDGFETLTVKQKFRAPWYQWTPVDFFSENLWPGEVRDERVLDFQLLPMRNVPNQELRQRAEDLRARARNGVVTPLPGFYGSVNPGSQLAPPDASGPLPPNSPPLGSPGGDLPPNGSQPLPAPARTAPRPGTTLPPQGMPLPAQSGPLPPPASPLPPGGIVLPDAPTVPGTPIRPEGLPVPGANTGPAPYGANGPYRLAPVGR